VNQLERKRDQLPSDAGGSTLRTTRIVVDRCAGPIVLAQLTIPVERRRGEEHLVGGAGAKGGGGKKSAKRSSTWKPERKLDCHLCLRSREKKVKQTARWKAHREAFDPGKGKTQQVSQNKKGGRSTRRRKGGSSPWKKKTV